MDVVGSQFEDCIPEEGEGQSEDDDYGGSMVGEDVEWDIVCDGLVEAFVGWLLGCGGTICGTMGGSIGGGGGGDTAEVEGCGKDEEEGNTESENMSR